MRIDEFEFRNKQGEEIEPTKHQLVIYIKSLHKQIADLEAKLAEKDERYIQSLIKLEKEYDEQLEKQAKIHYRHLKEKDQDKISLALEQLEKVKEYIDNHKCKTINDDRYVVYRKSLVDTIDNQIKQLKEGK